MVFHSPQLWQRPDHLGYVAPQEVQAKIFLTFDKGQIFVRSCNGRQAKVLNFLVSQVVAKKIDPALRVSFTIIDQKDYFWPGFLKSLWLHQKGFPQ